MGDTSTPTLTRPDTFCYAGRDALFRVKDIGRGTPGALPGLCGWEKAKERRRLAKTSSELAALGLR